VSPQQVTRNRGAVEPESVDLPSLFFLFPFSFFRFMRILTALLCTGSNFWVGGWWGIESPDKALLNQPDFGVNLAGSDILVQPIFKTTETSAPGLRMVVSGNKLLGEPNNCTVIERVRSAPRSSLARQETNDSAHSRIALVVCQRAARFVAAICDDEVL
jgi:hypothetical protein